MNFSCPLLANDYLNSLPALSCPLLANDYLNSLPALPVHCVMESLEIHGLKNTRCFILKALGLAVPRDDSSVISLKLLALAAHKINNLLPNCNEEMRQRMMTLPFPFEDFTAPGDEAFMETWREYEVHHYSFSHVNIKSLFDLSSDNEEAREQVHGGEDYSDEDTDKNSNESESMSEQGKTSGEDSDEMQSDISNEDTEDESGCELQEEEMGYEKGENDNSTDYTEEDFVDILN